MSFHYATVGGNSPVTQVLRRLSTAQDLSVGGKTRVSNIVNKTLKAVLQMGAIAVLKVKKLGACQVLREKGCRREEQAIRVERNQEQDLAARVRCCASWDALCGIAEEGERLNVYPVKRLKRRWLSEQKTFAD